MKPDRLEKQEAAGQMTMKQITKKEVVKAVWFITLGCNFKCNYCHAEQVGDPLLGHPFEKPERWIEAWNRIEGRVQIDITGGEPFIQPGFIDILENLDDHKTVAITTNLSGDVTRFVQRISPRDCFSITASLHPSQPMNVEAFLGKALLLKNRGFDIHVNFVAYPEQMWGLERFRNLVQKHGLYFHVDPYLPGPAYPYEPTEKERCFPGKYFGSDRDDPYNKQVHRYLCDAGMNYFVVSPDGRVSPCVSRIYSEKWDMGNIFDRDFKLLKEPIRCASKFCSGCDADKTVRIVVGEDEEKKGEAPFSASPFNTREVRMAHDR